MKSEVKGTATSKRLGNTAVTEHSTLHTFVVIITGEGGLEGG